MDAEDIVKTISEVDIDATLDALQASDIAMQVKKEPIKAAYVISDWFQKQYRAAMGARTEVARFKQK
eukprot:4628958-Karenia_brevis.AAC.1